MLTASRYGGAPSVERSSLRGRANVADTWPDPGRCGDRLHDAMAIRHAYTTEPDGIDADSTVDGILEYTRTQSALTAKFLTVPPRCWVVFIREGGAEARLWSVVESRGELWNDGTRRVFDAVRTDHMIDLRYRLVIGWRPTRRWWMRAATAATYPVTGIADAEPIPFPGFDRPVLNYGQLQAVMREPRCASWSVVLSSGMGIT